MIEEWFKDSENKGKSLTVAIFCSKGRHRSVSAAILLRDLFYPNAVCEGHGLGVLGGHEARLGSWEPFQAAAHLERNSVKVKCIHSA